MQERRPQGTHTMSTANAKVTTVADVATSATILEKKLARRGASIHNQSSAILYLRMDGGTAAISAGNFSVAVAASGGQYEVPFGFKGKITGIWASDAGGYANVTEYA